MSEIIASPSVRAKARERGINLEQRAKQLGRSHLTLDDLSDTVPAGTQTDHGKYWDVDHLQYGPVTTQPTSRFAKWLPPI